MAAHTFDIVVVGTGPGGYVCAIRAAQLGLSVGVVEDDRPGGVCLNWGCIPTKALLRNAEVVHLFERAETFGITVQGMQADYGAAIKRSRGVADRMAKGVEFLFRKNKITLFPGTGALKSRTTVEVKGASGTETLEARRAVILATGSEPKSLPGVTIDEKTVISSNGAVRNEAKPPKFAMTVWHPKLGAAPAIEKDAGKSGVARLDAYGAQRIAGSLASPGNGKAAYAWNKAIRLDVRFDAPLSRTW